MTDPENKGHHSRGVNFDTLGSWNNRLDMPIWYEQSIIKGIPIPRIPLDEIGIASVIGRRKVNEDRFIFKELAPQSLLYFGIFDGHGGSYAVDYVCNNLENHMLYWLTQTSDLTKVLHQSFVDINNVLTRHIVHYHAGKSVQREKGLVIYYVYRSVEICNGSLVQNFIRYPINIFGPLGQ